MLRPIMARLGYPVFPATAEYGDIVKGLPITANSCRAIYCSHVSEQLALADVRRALKLIYTYLQPGGVFRCVQPDLELLAQEYLRSGDAQAVRFVAATRLGKVERPRGLAGLLRTWLGNSAHLWMWDYKSLAAELARVGFCDIRRATFGDSADVHFAAVEDINRWRNPPGHRMSQAWLNSPLTISTARLNGHCAAVARAARPS